LNAPARAWEAYVRYFYKTDPRDSRLYHLMIDTTAVSLEATTDLIVAAASAPAPTDT
jgi:cytidylate kinase